MTKKETVSKRKMSKMLEHSIGEVLDYFDRHFNVYIKRNTDISRNLESIIRQYEGDEHRQLRHVLKTLFDTFVAQNNAFKADANLLPNVSAMLSSLVQLVDED